MNAMDRLAALVLDAQAAVAASALVDKELVTVSADGNAVQSAENLAAGAIIIYPLPGTEWPAPKVSRFTWTYGVVCDGPDAVQSSARIIDLVEVLRAAHLIRFNDRAVPTDFALGKGAESRTIIGYAVTHTEEIHT